MVRVLAFVIGVVASINLFAVIDSQLAPPKPKLIDKSPLISMGLSNDKHLDKAFVDQHTQKFQLMDGTKLRALTVIHNDDVRRPLILANFGLFSSPRSAPMARVLTDLILPGKLNVDFIAIESVSSAVFFLDNRELGAGGYEEGRIILEVAKKFAKVGQSVTLLGVSLGGSSVMHAMIENERLQLGLVNSAIIFSGVLNEQESTQAVVTGMNHPLNLPSAQLGAAGSTIIDMLMLPFLWQVKASISAGQIFGDRVGDFFYSMVQNRLEHLSATHELNWNSTVRLDSVESYVQTSSQLQDQSISIKHPIYVINAQDDPVVPFSEFQAFESKNANNPYIITRGTEYGSHYGFFMAYGQDWMQSLFQRAVGN